MKALPRAHPPHTRCSQGWWGQTERIHSALETNETGASEFCPHRPMSTLSTKARLINVTSLVLSAVLTLVHDWCFFVGGNQRTSGVSRIGSEGSMRSQKGQGCGDGSPKVEIIKMKF